MCGLAGVLGLASSVSIPAVLPRMAGALAHRGPDDEGFYVDGTVGLALRRLAILDLSPAGHQPMSTPDGLVTIAFNGEIYNYVELRRELQAHGHEFRSSGDTEVLLAAYCQWGAACLPRLNGMWAFLIHDRRRNVLFGARDRFGMKPLYVHRGADAVLFASEIKAIRASGLYRGGVAWPTAARYLLAGRLDDTPETFFEGITQVRAGSAFEFGMDGTCREWRYWSLEEIAEQAQEDPPSRFAELFEDSIRLELRSDVPVGVTLSGGLDSTSILCACARLRDECRGAAELRAFCYSAAEFDESEFVTATLEQTQVRASHLDTSPDQLWSDFTRMLWYQDEPVHAMPALVGFQLMRLVARSGVKVVLSGQGADEVIGGYHSYFGNYWRTLLLGGHVRRAWMEMRSYGAAHGQSQLALLRSQARLALFSGLSSLAPYQWLRDRRRLAGHRWFSRDLAVRWATSAPSPAVHQLRDVLLGAVRVDPLPVYLRVEDRNAMAHSIESRLPFLDHRLVEFVFSLGPEWRMRGPWNKYVLRSAMRGRIPEVVRTREAKMGFPTPWRRWSTNELYEPIRDVLASRGARERGIYNLAAIERDLERSRGGGTDVSSRIFDTVQFELWAQSLSGGPGAPSA